MSNRLNALSISMLPIELHKAQLRTINTINWLLDKYTPYLECPYCKQVGFKTTKGCSTLLRCNNSKCGLLPSVNTVILHNTHNIPKQEAK